MQERGRKSGPSGKTPSGDVWVVPVEHWEELAGRSTEDICLRAGIRKASSTELLLPFLKEHLLVDLQNHTICTQVHAHWAPLGDPLLELMCLVYLLNVGDAPIGQKKVSVHELKTAHFFSGPHALKIGPVLKRYGQDPEGFKRAAACIGGEPLNLADISYVLWVFPKVPVYYLFWKADEEFPASLSVLFDRSIESHLPSDAIWGIVNLVSDMLVKEKRLVS